jgi:urease accessory protein
VRLDRLYQEGCAKLLLPQVTRDTREMVLVNTAGGVAGGDRFEWRLSAGPGAALVVTTQAAERVYRSLGPAARIETALTLGPGASLEWLPQETILFEAARLERRLEAEMAEDARLTVLEAVALGRAAMGEAVATGALSDQWRIRRGGRLIHAEALRADGDLARAIAGPATMDGCRALATLVHVAPGAGACIDAARAMLEPGVGVLAGASARDDVLIVRILARDLAPLRATVVRFLERFRRARPPSVWPLEG